MRHDLETNRISIMIERRLETAKVIIVTTAAVIVGLSLAIYSASNLV